ncbi:MAG TPA: hypothetical protein PK329_10845 [Myxococcota bacterium]|nr:hypothetical protein [Myxococcota bacterium]HON26580.1 hypothetical protein [Myxococcota bacterium]HOS62957.1 hypothetical protein [Myxococcota bacterium]HPC92213.1 hypothetical protein [Myxococcota bacterium]HPL26161.1 hypothetical protein [Myxococcota bacterium]
MTLKSSMRVLLLAVLLFAVSSCQDDPDSPGDNPHCQNDPICSSAQGSPLECDDSGEYECVGSLDDECGRMVYQARKCPEGQKCNKHMCAPLCDDSCLDDPEFLGDWCFGLVEDYCPKMQNDCYATIDRECPDGKVCSQDTQMCENPGQ